MNRLLATLALVAACAIPGVSAGSTGLFLDLPVRSLDLPLGADHPVEATVRDADGPAPGRLVSFLVETGPNAAAAARTCLTDATGTCAVVLRSEVAGTDRVAVSLGGAALPAPQAELVELHWHPAVLDAPVESARLGGGGQAQVEVVVRSATDPGVLLTARVDIEVASGPNDNIRYGQADATCLAAAAPCVFTYTGQHAAGTDVIRAWIDADLQPTVPGEADWTETADAGLGAGSIPEDDGTDVVEREWSDLGAAAGGQCPESEEQLGTRIVGTPGDDTIIGTPNGDVICGLGGHDVIVGGGGDDAIMAGLGESEIDGGAGFDFVTYHTSPGPITASLASGTVETAFGRDRLLGIEAVVGSFFDDLLIGGDGADSFNGTYGDDRIVGGGSGDILYDFAGDDVLVGGDGTDLLIAQGGDDLLSGGDDEDRLFGGKGDDRLRGGLGADRCVDPGGDDRFRGCEATADRDPRARIGGIDTGRWRPLYFPLT